MNDGDAVSDGDAMSEGDTLTEGDAVERVENPVITSSIAEDLHALGLEAGDTVLVHASMSELGWVCGGPQAIVDAFMDVLTPEGTLVVPTHTSQYSDPANWSNPPVPEHWYDQIAEHMPPYRPEVTPTRGMGAISECFRNYPGVVRSGHPEFSAAAWGAGAEEIVSDHEFDYGLGNNSPYARVYERDGDVLLVGVGHEVNTSLHLGEHRGDFPKTQVSHTAPVLEDGKRTVVEYEDVATSTEDFPDVGAAFEAEFGITEGMVGAASAKLLPQRPLVDFAVDFFEANRSDS